MDERGDLILMDERAGLEPAPTKKHGLLDNDKKMHQRQIYIMGINPKTAVGHGK